MSELREYDVSFDSITTVTGRVKAKTSDHAFELVHADFVQGHLYGTTLIENVAVREVNPNREPVLCYVEDAWAYFTTQPLADQWGDDWNDIPYEHNAGRPYDPSERDLFGCKCFEGKHSLFNPRNRALKWKTDSQDGYCDGPKELHQPIPPKEPWEIIQVAFWADLNTPDYAQSNSPYSVQSINAGAIAWLQSPEWVKEDRVVIPAGTTLSEFKRLIAKAGGRVYEETTRAGKP